MLFRTFSAHNTLKHHMQPHNNSTEEGGEADPSTASRLAGIVATLILGVALLLLTIAIATAIEVKESTLIKLATSCAAFMAGLLIVGWKRPYMFLLPLQRSWSMLIPWLRREINSRLTEPAQRSLFVFSVIAALPWLAFGLVGELFASSSVKEYLRETFYPLFNTVFEFGSWSYTPHWFHWLMLFSLIALALAFSWRHTCQPLAKWVMGRGSK